MSLSSEFLLKTGALFLSATALTGCGNLDPKYYGQAGQAAGRLGGAIIGGIALDKSGKNNRYLGRAINAYAGANAMGQLGAAFGKSLGEREGWCNERSGNKAVQTYNNGVLINNRATVQGSTACVRTTAYGTPAATVPGWNPGQGQARTVGGLVAEISAYTIVDSGKGENGVEYPIVRGKDGQLCIAEKQPDQTLRFIDVQRLQTPQGEVYYDQINYGDNVVKGGSLTCQAGPR